MVQEARWSIGCVEILGRASLGSASYMIREKR
jgi:hypothetical protein